MSTVTVEVTRPLMFRGERVETGTRLDVAAADAAMLVDSTRARLHREADAPTLEQARRDEVARALRSLGRHPAMPPADPRWQLGPRRV